LPRLVPREAEDGAAKRAAFREIHLDTGANYSPRRLIIGKYFPFVACGKSLPQVTSRTLAMNENKTQSASAPPAEQAKEKAAAPLPQQPVQAPASGTPAKKV
jgi:hypothetical protein